MQTTYDFTTIFYNGIRIFRDAWWMHCKRGGLSICTQLVKPEMVIHYFVEKGPTKAE